MVFAFFYYYFDVLQPSQVTANSGETLPVVSYVGLTREGNVEDGEIDENDETPLLSSATDHNKRKIFSRSRK